MSFLQYVGWEEESCSRTILDFTLEHISQSHHSRIQPALLVRCSTLQAPGHPRTFPACTYLHMSLLFIDAGCFWMRQRRSSRPCQLCAWESHQYRHRRCKTFFIIAGRAYPGIPAFSISMGSILARQAELVVSTQALYASPCAELLLR